MNKYDSLTERSACSKCGRMLSYDDRAYHIKWCDGNGAFQKLLRSKIMGIITEADRILRGCDHHERVWRDIITEEIMDRTKMRPGFSFVVKISEDMLGQMHVCVDVAGMDTDIEYLCNSLMDNPPSDAWFNNGMERV